MRQKTYSLYEAKTKLSEIIRDVRERGVSVTISYHGRPVAEIRPVPPDESADPLAKRLKELTDSGVISRATGKFQPQPIANRPGALARFLEDRNRF